MSDYDILVELGSKDMEMGDIMGKCWGIVKKDDW